METDDFDTLPTPGPISDGGDDVINTIDYTDCTFGFNYTDMKGVTHWVREPLNSQGYASIARPDDFVTSNRIELALSEAALPPSGKYLMSVKFTSNTGGFTYAYGFVYTQRNYENANIIKSTDKVTNFTQSSGDFWYTTTFDLSACGGSEVNHMTVGAQIPPVGGYWKVEFTRLSSSTNTDISSAGSNMSDPSQDTAQNTQQIADNTQAIVDGQDSIMETIKDQVQYITMQLESFWNQLAGEFTNLYNKMNTHHEEDLNAISDQTDEITAGQEEQTDTLVDKLEDTKKGIIGGIIDGLKSLFIPSNEYFKSWFDKLYTFFDERLGFLMLPVDLVVKFAELFSAAQSSSAGVPFPEFKWIDGTVIIPAQTVGFDFLETDWGQDIHEKLYFVGNLIMIGALLSLMHRKFEEVLRG